MAQGWQKEIDDLLGREAENGGPHWSRTDGDIHAPAGFCTIDVLTALGGMGARVDAHGQLQTALDFVRTFQNDDGSFSYNKRKTHLPCMTARILAAFGWLHAPIDEELEASYQHLIGLQWGDGGWRCATAKLGKSAATDTSNPGTTLFVLDAFRFRKNNASVQKSLNRAAFFLLDHWESRLPLGPCEFGLGSRFLKVEYPFRRYTLFYYVFVLAHYKCVHKDKRFLAALDELATHVQGEEIILDVVHKAWREYAPFAKDKPSTLAAQYWKEIARQVGGPA